MDYGIIGAAIGSALCVTIGTLVLSNMRQQHLRLLMAAAVVSCEG